MNDLLEIKVFLERRLEAHELLKKHGLDLMDEYDRGIRIGIIMGYENTLKLVDSKIEKIKI